MTEDGRLVQVFFLRGNIMSREEAEDVKTIPSQVPVNCSLVVLECGDVGAVNSGGIGALMQVYTSLLGREAKVSVKFTSLHRRIIGYLHILGLDKVWDLYPSLTGVEELRNSVSVGEETETKAMP
jgi:anti-anti-sigma regulatory factor